ncbi:hypothetical protein [Streptomyces olivochromogenes]|uniref:hypothetical protein n=1 Tax=Streptomyces olivochromogenes TaxID=1963 RepID=UPI001F316207|nr:hypothetical protein [Streptomyces olivochromogenes]MCF3132848.1 hypothetical protein [Streptomyces olivochromogenes]
MRRHALRATKKTCLLVAALGLALPAAGASAQTTPRKVAPALAPAAAAVGVHFATADLALSGPLTLDKEHVDVTGRITVTVVTRANAGGGGTAQIISSLRDTTGVGRTTHGTYRFFGASTDTVSWPPEPVSPVVVSPRFLVFPPGPVVPPNPVRPVRVTVILKENGKISNISARVQGTTADTLT